MTNQRRPKPPFSNDSHFAMLWNATESLYSLRQHGLGDLDAGAIRTAIAAGELSGRPLNISRIAESTGLPRPTVKRKLDRLEQEGLVVISSENGHQVVRHNEDRYQEWRDFLDVICARVLRVGEMIHDAERPGAG